MGGAPVIETIRPGVQFEPGAAASFRRAEADLGRRIDCNSSYRDYGLQLSMYQAWTAWTEGWGPKPPHSRALAPWLSKHCMGLALDSDDWTTPGFIAFMAERGWIRTAPDDPTEQHHFEYQWWRDQHRNRPAGGESRPFEEDTLSAAEVADIKAHVTAEAGQTRAFMLKLTEGVPGDGAVLVAYRQSRQSKDHFALYRNGMGLKFRVRVTDPAAIAALEHLGVLTVDQSEIWPHDIVWTDDGDSVPVRPGEHQGYATSGATGNVFELFVDANGNKVRRLVTDPAELAKITDAPVMAQTELWKYAAINQ